MTEGDVTETHGLLAAHDSDSDSESGTESDSGGSAYAGALRRLARQARTQQQQQEGTPDALKWRRRQGGTRNTKSSSSSASSSTSCGLCSCLFPHRSKRKGERPPAVAAAAAETSAEDAPTLPRETLCRRHREELQQVLLPIAALPFDPSRRDHRDVFRAICELLCVPADGVDEPGGGDFARRLGFQSACPGHDLRGVGMLGALQLLAWCEQHTAQAQMLLAVARSKSPGGSDPFPMAATLLNITRFIFTVLVDGDGAGGEEGSRGESQLATMCNGTDGRTVLDVANEVYAAAAAALAQTWSEGCYRVVDMTSVLARIDRSICTAPHALVSQFRHNTTSSRSSTSSA